MYTNLAVHRNKIMKKILSFLAVFFLSIVLIDGVFAQEPDESYYYYVIPPSKYFSLNDEIIQNQSRNEAKMLFKNADQELIQTDHQTSGLRIFSKYFQTDLKKETQVLVTDSLHLLTGSIHIATNPGSTTQGKVFLGNLIMFPPVLVLS